MHPADKAVLRLAIGLGVATLLAYGLALRLGYVACVLAVVGLCKPGPPLTPAKGIVSGLVVAVLLLAGRLMVPLLEHYAFTGLLLTGALLYCVFFSGARSASALTTIFAIALTIIPAAAVAEQRLATALALAIGAGLGVAALVASFSHALFPDPPRAAVVGVAKAPAPTSAEAAHWRALQSVVVILPVFV